MRTAGLLAALLAFAACVRAAPASPAPIHVESDEVEAHRLSEYEPVRHSSAQGGADRIPLLIVVDAAGHVADARLETNPRSGGRAWPAAVATQALGSARRWRYRPFTRAGAPVAVTFVETISLYPPEDRPVRRVPMPPFDSSVRIALRRTGCFGTCPGYTVEIAADGAVLFNGDTHVFARGVHRARIDPAAVRRLYDLARRADFFSLRESYAASMTDAPTYSVMITAGGRAKTVDDYVGETVGMPRAVRALEDAIDAAAGTRRWTQGDESSVPRLIREGYDFRGYEGARMLAAAALGGKARLVAQLAEAGAPFRAAAPADGLAGPVDALGAAAQGGDPATLAFVLSRRSGWSRAELHDALGRAAAGGRHDAFLLLVRRGVLATTSPAQATQMLRAAVPSGDPRLTALLLTRHPDVNWIDRTNPNDPILAEAARATCPWDRRPPVCDPAMSVQLLLRAGADPRTVNPTTPGSPLAFVGDVRIARLLIAAGADPNFPDFEGEPPIFSVYDEDVALALLDAGANPRARRPGDQMTVAGWARYQQWPRVLARLEAGIR